MDLSIIIVNWKSADFLRRCLRTIYETQRQIQFEVIVIDNASFDGSRQVVESEFSDASIVESSVNLGFAGANNAAFEHATGRNVLFLNPDTEIIGSALESMVSTLDSNPDAGIVGCRLLNSDGSVQTSCIQSFPTVFNQLVDTELFRSFSPRARIWGTAPLFSDSSIPVTVEVVSGACLMIKRAVFEQVGGFTSAYFIYGEDADLCYKVKRAGWRVEYLGTSQVIHHGGRSSNARESLFATVMMKQSLCEFIRRRQGREHALLFRAFIAVASLVRLIVLSIIFGFTLGLFRPALIGRAAEKWFNVLRWALGFEQWAKNPLEQHPRSATI